MFIAGINDTRDKLFTDVNDTGDQLLPVVVTGDKLLPVSMTPAIIIRLVPDRFSSIP